MKKLFLSMILLALPLVVSAYDCEVDGFYYNLVPKGNVAEMTSGDTKYSGSVTIPEKFTYDGVEYSVTTIGNYTFSGCSGLTSVTIPNSVTSIGDRAFYLCHDLTSVTIPNSVISIGVGAFSNCSGLTSVTIPNSVTYIGAGAFHSCIGLTSVSIPNSVTNIESETFLFCSSLTSVTIPNSVVFIGASAFCYCTSLTSAIIPNSVISIGGSAFQCTALTSVTIPNSVGYIGNWAFRGCSDLSSVTIPNSVTTIGSYAFADCSKLENVYCLTEQVPYTNTNAFDKSYPENAMLYVPAESLNEYKTTEPWSLFGTIKAISGTGEEPTKCATPTISYGGKRLTFSCETEGVEYVYEIKDADIKKGYDATVDLTATYEISVYATKAGYENSDIATATLVWTDAIFTETTEPATSAKAVQESIPVLISAKSGNISVRCEADGQEVNVYTIDGLSLGSATVKNGEALISTSIPSGDIAVVKVGGRSMKVIMR